MSLITNNTNIWNGEDVFLKQVPDPLYTSTINVQYLNAGEATIQNLNATVLAANSASINSLSSGTASISSLTAQNVTASTIASKIAYISTLSTTAINLDGNILTTSTTSGVSEILINGVPIATTSTLASSILMWSKYPQVDTLDSAGYDISSTRNLYASTIQANSGNLSTIAVSSIFANSEIVNLISAQQILVSSINSGTVNSVTGNFSTILVSSINSGSANFSTIVGTDLSTNTISTNNLYAVNATFQNAPTFSNGATFNGGRPNFNSGFITSGPNNFNNTAIDNAPNINTQSGNAMTIRADGGMTLASKTSIQENASTTITLQTDRGADVGGNSVINLNAKFGAKTQVNITADVCSAVAIVPTSVVAITAKGNSSIAPTFVPVGGKITLNAEAGSGSGTAVVAYGEIDLTANSFGITQPGFIKLSGGSNAMYSGAVSPAVGVYGQNYIWGQLGNSFAASTTPPVIPTLVQSNYFYAGLGALGPAYQIVGNRFQGGIGVDFIQPFPGADLVIQGSLSGTDGITMSSIRNINMSTSGAITGVGNINLSSINSAPYPPVVATTSSFDTASISALTVSSINNLAYPPASGWVSTATSPLNMAGFDINTAGGNINLNNGNLNNVSLLAGNTSGFLNINANFGMVIDINQGAELRLNTNADIGLKTLSTAQISIYQPGSSDITLFNNGDARMNTKRNASVIAGGNMDIVTPSTNQLTIYQQGGSDFVLFNNGDTRMNAKRNAFVEATGDANMNAGGNVAIRTVSSQYITLEQQGSGNQSYIQLRPDGSEIVNARNFVELVANAGTGGIYCTSAFTELRGYLTFNAVNNYINNLEHIYGDTSAPGGGLAIDYMYGMFFNGTGKNANLYIDSGNLNMINYNSGINIANYNGYGTGNLSLYSQNNDIFLGTGTGRDINLNGGRYVSINAAQPGGSFGIYASTINATSLLDTNITANQNITLRAEQPGNSITQIASTITLLAANNINTTSLLDTNITIGQNLNVNASTINTTSLLDTNITANKNMTLSANNFGNYITLNSGQVNRTLLTVSVAQPVIQYGTEVVSGSSGSVSITIPTPYTSASSYVAFISMEDTAPAETSVTRDTDSQITLYWNSGGSGSHTLAWNTMGT
jgi:hypothetical protein